MVLGPSPLGQVGVQDGLADSRLLRKTIITTSCDSMALLKETAMSIPYAIRPGDTLSRLARLHSITLSQLLALNPQVENPDLIRVGEMILVPDGGPAPAPVLAEENDQSSDPLWLKIARREMGVAETPGAADHTLRVLEYLAVCSKTDPALRSRDETPWCSAFACWVMEQAGHKSPKTAWARTWFDQGWGEEEPKGDPRRGAITVFRRGNGGHVGFFIEDLGDRVAVLGGNQANKVKISNYPKLGDHYELLGYRWPD